MMLCAPPPPPPFFILLIFSLGEAPLFIGLGRFFSLLSFRGAAPILPGLDLLGWVFRLTVKRISLSLSLSFFFCYHWTLEEAMEDADGKERR
jgi:hypothetical protein